MKCRKNLIMKAFYFFVGLLIFTYGVSQNKQTLQKEIVRNLSVNTSSTLEINNTNGDLNLEVWQKNEIEVRVVIEVTTEKVKFINQYIQAIFVSEALDSNYIRFTTKVDRSLLDHSFNNQRSSYKINYYIKHPVYLNVKLYNKFGNVYVDELSGNFYLNLDYGTAYISNLTTDESKKIPRIDLDYSKCVIKKSQFLEADVDYSKLNVNDVQTISLSSKYSKVEINLARIIKASSRFDDFNVNSVSKINLKTAYSDVQILEIYSSADVVSEHGVVSVKRLMNGFTDGYFDVAFTELKIGLDRDICLQLDANIKFGDIFLPKRANVDNYISLRDRRSKGTLGCISNYSGKLNIEANFCDVVITE